MQVVEGGMKAIEARARHEAKQRQQSASTSHLLLVLLHRQGEAGRLLQHFGLRETGLLSALKAVEAEPVARVERTMERAAQLARDLRHADATELHLLAVLIADSRSHARRSLNQLGVELDELGTVLSQRLGLVSAPAPAPESVREPARAAPRPPALPPGRSPLRTAVVREPRPTRPTSTRVPPSIPPKPF